MIRDLNILVCPGGTEIGLEINKALRFTRNISLFSAGMDIPNHAPYVFLRHFPVPGFQNKHFLTELNNIINAHAIDYVFPAHDDVLTELARHRHELKAGLVTSPLKTCLIARSKSATYAAIASRVPMPICYSSADEVDVFPVCLKPDSSQGSEGVRLAWDRQELEMILRRSPDLLILEYLPGAEYTVDCFSDRGRGLLYVAGRERVRTRAGISVTTVSASLPAFKSMAESIAAALVFHGTWFFQVKADRNGILKLLEIAPRIGGAMAYDRVKGVNLPLLSIYEQERLPLSIRALSIDIVMDRALTNRYSCQLKYTTVYVDFDDTLFFKGKLNAALVGFLCQSANMGKKNVLLTKHAGDLHKSLSQMRITELFDRIIHLPCNARKADYINAGEDAIFIDDSFSERMDVLEKKGVMSFDCSMLELLIDERA
ncbi:MAG: ATP-grasp domain-containing protein [Kiritimatiellia bacterium]|nr:ATP-grasp domain-containing protein [Kiritimatiellia bacterium]